jgi:hypothetical protein
VSGPRTSTVGAAFNVLLGALETVFAADGIILFARIIVGPLFRVSASGGEAVAVTKLDRQYAHRFPSFLPDGRHFLFSALESRDTPGIYLGALDAGDTTRLTAGYAAGMYLPSGLAGALREGGLLVWVSAGTLLAQRLDVTGEPSSVIRDGG